MKRYVSGLLALVLLWSAIPFLPVQAEIATNGTCGENLTWVLDDDGTLTISGSGPMTNYDVDNFVYPEWSAYGDSIKKIVVEEGITTVGDGSFAALSYVTFVELPESVTYIGYAAFFGCERLEYVNIPNAVQRIGVSAFYGCSALTKVKIPGSVKTIDAYAFANCYMITDLELEEGLMEIGSWAFSECGSIRNLSLPDSVTTIKAHAFDGIHSLKTVTISKNVSRIDGNVFMRCYELREIFVDPENVTYHSFGNCLIGTESKTLVSGCSASQIPADGTVEIIGVGAFAANYAVHSMVIPESVTHIARGAFAGCNNLRAVILPTSLVSIADEAFGNAPEIGAYGCECLQSVYYFGTQAQWDAIDKGNNTVLETAERGVLPANGTCGENLTWQLDVTGILTISGAGEMYDYTWENLPAWNDHKAIINKVVVNPGVTTIGDYAFSDNYMSCVVLPDGLLKIGKDAFSGCCYLTEMEIPQSVTYIGDDALWCCCVLERLEIPTGLTYWGEWAFSKLMSVKEITIPSTYTEIPTGSFNNCHALTNVTIPNTIKTIGESAFSACESLQTVDIPEGVEVIGEDAFSWCGGLEAFYIPKSVREMNPRMFVSSHPFFYVDEQNAVFSADAEGVLYNKEKTVLLMATDSLTGEYTIPGSVTSIENSAFSGCEKLEKIAIPSGVTEIGDYTFYDCQKLHEVELPNHLTRIGNDAFSNCRSLRNIAIPESVVEIDEFAFSVTGLTDITLPSGLTEVTNGAFSECRQLTTVKVPDGVKKLAMYSFSGCSALKEVHLPASLETIEYAAFMWAPLENVYFGGSREQWGAILVDSGNESLESANVHFGGIGGVCGDNLSWSIADCVLSISGTGDMYDYNWETGNYAPWSEYADLIVHVMIGDGVTSIGTWAFDTIPMMSIDIPGSVSVIGDYAFIDCEDLTDIYIPYGVTHLGISAFKGCSSLEHIELPESLTTIDYAAFNDCNALKHIKYTGTLEQKAAISIGELNVCLTDAIWYFGNTVYSDDLQETLDTVLPGTTVVVVSDETVKNLFVDENVVLDLNGHSLTTNYFTCYGKVIDGEQGGAGLLKVNKQIHIAGQNSYLPIYDPYAGGYRFYIYDIQNLGWKAEEGSDAAVKFGIRLTFENPAAYDALLTTSADSLRLLAYMEWKGLPGTFLYTFSNDTVRNYAEQVKADIASMGHSSKAITLTIGGLDMLGDDGYLLVQPAVETKTGMIGCGGKVCWEPPMETVQWIDPVEFISIRRDFGYTKHPVTGNLSYHNGIVLGAKKGIPIYASRSGIVTSATYNSSIGYSVTIDHQDGYISRYGHMTHYIVAEGDAVVAGQVIGYCGSTGMATGPQVYFCITYNGQYVNPHDFIDFTVVP